MCEVRSPILAAVSSLFLSGLDQIYDGELTKGIVFIVVQIINATSMTVLIWFVLMPVVALWTPVGRYETA